MGELSKESLWFDLIEPETGTVAYQDYGHLNQYVIQVEQELVPLLEPFLFQLATPQVIYQIKQTVDAYFSTQWVVNEGVNVVVDLDPVTSGIKITAVINYGADEEREYDFGNIEYDEPDINFEVDFFFDYTLDEALEVAMPDTEKEDKDTSSVEDILFEPVDLEKERNQKPPQQPVYDDLCYD